MSAEQTHIWFITDCVEDCSECNVHGCTINSVLHFSSFCVEGKSHNVLQFLYFCDGMYAVLHLVSNTAGGVALMSPVEAHHASRVVAIKHERDSRSAGACTLLVCLHMYPSVEGGWPVPYHKAVYSYLSLLGCHSVGSCRHLLWCCFWFA